MQFEFEHGDRSAHLQTGNAPRLESFPDKFDLINTQANISQTEDPFDVGCSGVMLAAGLVVQIKLHAGNRTPILVAN